ncbi:MAG TPA: IPT/TIG domain-containing protein, partial [Solirubrobacteraceae bacterium]|nr:IPT/TIG domain-containing protein [Solirubrobacteraceae bacterium]
MKAIRSRTTATLFVCAALITVPRIAHAAAPSAPGAAPKPAAAAIEDPFNARISIDVAADGRFAAGAFPNPLTGGQTASSYPILFGWPTTSTSFATVMVDGVADVYGSSGTQVQAPTEAGAANTSAWSNGDVTTRQTLSVATNPVTGMADAARIAYTVTNGGTVSHSVGVRTLLDTDVDNNDGSPFLIPALGPVTTEQDLAGAAVPDNFEILPALGAGTRLAGAILRGADATPPDRLVVADWPRIGATAWDYTITPGRLITTDSAYAVYWNPRALGPGASVTFVTYYAAVTPPAVTALNPPSGPTSGGTAVTITGTELTGATAVAFGSVPAAGFRVDGPTQITATAPPGTGTVAVGVTTPEGTSAPSDADLFTYAGSPPTPTQPTSQTQPAEGVTSDSAELQASINPRGLATTMHFEYGVDPGGATVAALSYGSRTPDQPVSPDFADHSLTAVVASLQPNSTYHVRAVATNALGVSAGQDVTFRTAVDVPPPPPVLGKAFNAQPVTGRVLILLPAAARSGRA